MEKYLTIATDLIIQYAPTVLLAIVVLIIGLRIISFLVKHLNKIFENRGVDDTLRPFLSSLISWVLKVMLFISVASMVGIATTSFVAVLGAAGLAIGLALQGSLANFAGGVLILLFKPFKVGDKIESMGRTGDVQKIQIFNTFIKTADNKTIILPNGAVMNADIVNYTTLGMIRVDLSIGIGYDSDIEKAKNIILETLRSHPNVLSDPAPAVGVSELGDSAIQLAVMPWCDPSNYWDVYFGSLQNCKIALDQAGIQIPYPQIDVHMASGASA